MPESIGAGFTKISQTWQASNILIKKVFSAASPPRVVRHRLERWNDRVSDILVHYDDSFIAHA